MFIEYDESMSALMKMTINKDYNGLFEALEALDSKDPKIPFVLGMIESLSGLKFEMVE